MNWGIDRMKKKKEIKSEVLPYETRELIANRDFVIWQPPHTPAPIVIKKGDDVAKLNLSVAYLENLKTEKVI